MDALVVGAGIGGLTAAIVLRHNGHRVKLFEQSRFAQESGAAIFLPPNANGPLRTHGFIAEDYGANTYRGTIHYTKTGELDMQDSYEGDEFPHRWDLIRRSALHTGLKQLATDPNGQGPPAELHTASRVASVDAEAAHIKLEDGSEFKGDFVLGADGAHSKARECIAPQDKNGKPMEPFNSGRNCFRFLIDRSKLKADPATQVYHTEGHLITWLGGDKHLVSYPCQNNEIINFVAIHPSNESDASDNHYTSGGSKETLMEIFKDFEPRVQGILRLVDPADVKLYPLNDMGQLPTYVKGRMALLGDAAHPFLPYLGQGGAQAIEDAIALGTLFPEGTKAGDVPTRLQLYEQARKTRAEFVQQTTRALGSGLGDEEPIDFQDLRKMLFFHDEIAHTKELMATQLGQAQTTAVA